MPVKQSAGLLMFRRMPELEVFLIHPGGPYFAGKHNGTWSIPKGELEPGEDPLACARREFVEETGLVVGESLVALGSVQQKGGKIVHAWAFEGDWDGAPVRSNMFSMEWPKNSGKIQSWPEVDEARFMLIPEARMRINEAQSKLLDTLQQLFVIGG